MAVVSLASVTATAEACTSLAPTPVELTGTVRAHAGKFGFDHSTWLDLELDQQVVSCPPRQDQPPVRAKVVSLGIGSFNGHPYGPNIPLHASDHVTLAGTLSVNPGGEPYQDHGKMVRNPDTLGMGDLRLVQRAPP